MCSTAVLFTRSTSNVRKSNCDLLNGRGRPGVGTNLEDFDLFSQQCLGLSQVLLVDALHCHLPVVFLHGHITQIHSCDCMKQSSAGRAASVLAVFAQHSQHVSANSMLRHNPDSRTHSTQE